MAVENDGSGSQTGSAAAGGDAADSPLDRRALLHAMPGPWIVLRPDSPCFTILEVSEDYARSALRSQEELVGRGLFEALPDANPENPDRTGEENVRASLEKVIRTRAPDRMEMQRYDAERPEGGWEEYYWEPLHTPVLGPDGEVLYILETLENVTGRVRAERAADAAERQLRMAFLQAPALVAVTGGPEHRFILSNPSFEEIVGRGELVGRTVGDALAGLGGEGLVAIMDEVYTTGVSYVANERRILFPRDEEEPAEGWYNFVCQPLLDADRQVTGILLHAVDVTTQVQARMEIEAARGEAERANRAKSEFLAVMSHELRTPLNAISGYTDILAMGVHGPVTDAQRKSLRRIQSSQHHLLGLINDVLNYAKLDTGSVNYDIGEIRVKEVFASVEALIAPQVRAAGLILSVSDIPPDLGVCADPEKLRQILLNLLTNAVKFTDGAGGNGRIELDAAVDGVSVHLRVGDTGIGIPPEKLDTIFEPFVQVRADLTRTADGVGLGLAISRDLARGMGGDLSVESEPGAGSTFTVTLPGA